MNPESFRPGQPVPIEFFVGRMQEVERLRSMVRAAVSGRFSIGFVTGERGIGKSSLVSFVRHLSERTEGTAGCHVFLGGVRALDEMVRRVFDRILKDSIDKPWHAKVREFFGDHVREVGLFGITLELDLKAKDLSTITHDFVPSIRRLLATLRGEKSALLLILDDINGLANSDEVANWLKSMVDEIATLGEGVPLCVLIVGLEDRRQELINRQPSLARVFELIDIMPWSDDETRLFYQKTFSDAGAIVDETSIELLRSFTGGFPVLAHEIGDAVWRTAAQPAIDPEEILQGIFLAAEVIGRKFLEPQVYSALRSERYRTILRKLADTSVYTEFRRDELGQRLTESERKGLDNFLRRMRELGAIANVPGARGLYRFHNRLHALYFWLESQRAAREM
jgi:hypothetical protein